jgi:hypothetical protein
VMIVKPQDDVARVDRGLLRRFQLGGQCGQVVFDSIRNTGQQGYGAITW